MTSEAKLIDLARQVITDEDVLAAALLQPRGVMEGHLGFGAAEIGGALAGGAGDIARRMAGGGELATGQAAAKAQDVPRYALVAVTPTRVHILAVHSTYLVNVRSPRPFAVLDRAACKVSKGSGTAVWWTLTDTLTGRVYPLEGVSRHGNEIMEQLASGTGGEQNDTG